MTIIKTIVTTACAVAYVGSATPVLAQVTQTQVIVSGTTPVKSTSASAVRDAAPDALNAAYRNAWRLMSTRPEFANKVQTLPAGSDDEIIASMKNECTVNALDQDVDKTARTLSARYRFDCRTQNLQGVILAINSRASGASAAAMNGQGSTIVFLFFAERDKTRTDHDPNVSRSDANGETTSSASRTTTAASFEASAKLKATSKNAELEKRGTSGGTTAQIDKQLAVAKMNAEGSSSAEVSGTHDARSETQRIERYSGQTIHASADYVREISRPDKLDASLKEVFLTSKIVSLADYADVEGDSCSTTANVPVPSMEQIEGDLRSLRPDQALALPPATRGKVIAVLRACEIPYLATAVAKIGIPDSDPVTGQVRVSVDVTAQVLKIPSLNAPGLPKTVGSVTRQVSGIGQDDTVAAGNALSAAARIVGEETLNMLSVRGVL